MVLLRNVACPGRTAASEASSLRNVARLPQGDAGTKIVSMKIWAGLVCVVSGGLGLGWAGLGWSAVVSRGSLAWRYRVVVSRRDLVWWSRVVSGARDSPGLGSIRLAWAQLAWPRARLSYLRLVKLRTAGN